VRPLVVMPRLGSTYIVIDQTGGTLADCVRSSYNLGSIYGGQCPMTWQIVLTT
jgi:hypothetical protein